MHNLAGASIGMHEVVAAISAAAPESAGGIQFDELLLPFPGEVDAASFERLVGRLDETPFADAVADAVTRFRDLVGRGLIDPEEVFRGQAG